MKRFKIAWSEYIETLQMCAQERRVHTVLERSGLSANDIKEGLLLLSLHKGPEFVIGAILETEEQLRSFCDSLRIVNSLQDDIGNLSFLLKQVNMISQHYEDSTDSENIGLNFVTILATKILSEKIKRQSYEGVDWSTRTVDFWNSFKKPN